MQIAIVYMVAGMSSRFGGRIKQFAKVGPKEQTLIEFSLDQALKAGFNKIYFIVGKLTEKPFKEKFGDNYKSIPIVYTLQDFDENKRTKPWGTTDAIVTLKEKIDCPFVICNGDDIYGEETFRILFNHLKSNNSCATIGYQLKNVLPEEGEVNRGIFQIENEKVKGIKEVFKISKENIKEKELNEESLCSMNIFALHPVVVEELSNILERFKKENENNSSVECLLPEELSNLIKQNKIWMQIYSSSEKWLGVTNPFDEEKVRKEILVMHKKD